MKIGVTSIFLSALVLAPATVHAYIDPGTGSVVTTAILGFFAAISYTLRRYFYRIKDAFTRENHKVEASADRSPSES